MITDAINISKNPELDYSLDRLLLLTYAYKESLISGKLRKINCRLQVKTLKEIPEGFLLVP